MQRSLSIIWGDYLNSMDWDVFGTITFKFSVGMKQARKLLSELEKRLLYSNYGARLFVMVESTYDLKDTHLHVLAYGNAIQDALLNFFNDRGLIRNKFCRFEKYNARKGASYYVSKYIQYPYLEYEMIVVGKL